MMLGIICWINKTTGERGHGLTIDEISASQRVKELNKDYPNINHWFERGK